MTMAILSSDELFNKRKKLKSTQIMFFMTICNIIMAYTFASESE